MASENLHRWVPKWIKHEIYIKYILLNRQFGKDFKLVHFEPLMDGSVINFAELFVIIIIFNEEIYLLLLIWFKSILNLSYFFI